MNKQATIPTTEISFKDYLFKSKRNRYILCLAGAAILIQFAIFKYLYPFASYIHGDSFSYINGADKNLSINTYLIGYSKFLRLFSVFSRSDVLLTAVQYLFIQCSVTCLILTLFYFYNPGKITQIILLCFMVFNPLFLHLANLISSDGFFLSLSMIWFTLLIWIIQRPSKKMIIWHAIVIFIAFTVRYNAMIYPVISIVAFGLSRISLRQKLVGAGAGIALCGLFVLFTSVQFKTLTGYGQYSPFSGWQLANNAMYAYRYVDSASRKPVEKRFQVLDNMVRNFYDSTRDVKKYPSEAVEASSFYMWSPTMPLVLYKNNLFKKDTAAKELKKWSSMGPYYKDYGLYIIKMYPGYFIRHFIWPNANKYFAPPIEFLESYNSGKPFITPGVQAWFGYKSTFVKTRMKNNKVWILDFYPILSGSINLAILCGLICYCLLKGWQYSRHFNKVVIIMGLLWFLNAAFTIGASSAALRYQSFPILITTISAALIIDWLIKLMTTLQLNVNSREKRLDTLEKSLPRAAV